MNQEQYNNLRIWRDEYAELSDEAFLSDVARVVVSQTQLVDTKEVVVYLANNDHLTTALFTLSQSPDAAHKMLHYQIQLALQMPRVDLKNAKFQAIYLLKEIPGAGVTDADIAGFFALGTVTEITADQERLGESVTMEHLNIMELLPKLEIATAKRDDYRAKFDACEQAMFTLQRGEDVDVEAL